MPFVPTPLQNNVVIQNNTTGVVDYLKYEGSTLVSSVAQDYGIGADWKVVADNTSTLVIQNDKTGFVDFLGIGASGALMSSAMSTTALPRLFGYSSDTGEFGSQLADGEIDMLKFDTTTGALTGSSLVAGSAGLPTAVGISTWNLNTPAWAGISSPGLNADVIDTQTASGQLDVIGLGGNFIGGLNVQTSFLAAGGVGSPAIGDVNSDSASTGYNYQNGAGNPQGLEATTMTAGGQIDLLYWDVGTPDTANAGVLYASNMLTGSYAGWSVVEGGAIESGHVFPVS
ncbi:hypothetical protein H8A95_17890 [Bradyrhizobium sp. Pear76]|uniref:hypothetical protein n=1 Tax=Bradyrhizobium oropedii TaxID=1571201 RepID=UPI001E55BB01|nr:hypothetical protein [Bradyrhizobium oropedii]MCC8964142.1 hypothetical protein [Bradyrhizobium oropedii]